MVPRHCLRFDWQPVPDNRRSSWIAIYGPYQTINATGNLIIRIVLGARDDEKGEVRHN